MKLHKISRARIQLREINPAAKTFHEAIGLSEERFNQIRENIKRFETPETLMTQWSITEKELKLGKISYPMPVKRWVQLIREIWSKKGQQEITVVKAVGTYLLLTQRYRDIIMHVRYGRLQIG